jgi:hypothetical protein
MFRTHLDIFTNDISGIYCDTNNSFIPLDPANSDYQRVLDDIIEQGADCFEGDIPTDLQDAADAKQFAQQVEAYKIAKARVAQYQLLLQEKLGTKKLERCKMLQKHL